MTDVPALRIGDRRVGPGEPTWVVAELSANHNRDLSRALAIVEAAAEAGADAVKLQTYTPDTMTLDHPGEAFRVRGTVWDGRTLHELYEEAWTPWEWHEPIRERARELGLGFFSTPFDATAVDFLRELDVPAWKIASFELVDVPLLQRVAATGKPVVLSTGMATLDEIGEAVDALRDAGCRELALLKCTSAYPAPVEEANLRTIPHLRDTFRVVVGLSDHTMDDSVPALAVALGASIVEKHLTLSRDDPGPDSAFSLEPSEFARMVTAVRTADAALGSVSYEPTEREKVSRAHRRSLFVVEDVARGEAFTPGNVRAIRPADGLHPRHLDAVLGRRAAEDVSRGTPLTWSLVAPPDED